MSKSLSRDRRQRHNVTEPSRADSRVEASQAKLSRLPRHHSPNCPKHPQFVFPASGRGVAGIDKKMAPEPKVFKKIT